LIENPKAPFPKANGLTRNDAHALVQQLKSKIQ